MATTEAPRSLLADVVTRAVTRRDVLKGVAGIAGLAALPALVAACGTSTPGGSAAATGTVHVGSNHSDPGEAKGMDAIDAAFTAASKITVVLNKVDHGTFQDQITSYLGGKPDTAFTWFSGFRMKFFASKGLATPIDDVWAKVKGNFSEGFATSVVGDDKKVYGIPVDYYPWAVFYRKSVFADKKYTIPATWDDLKALCTKMQADGLTPIAFGDKDGWPAMGTFDILNLRINGYDFHVNLMSGKEKWTDAKVTAVFKKWAEIVPFHAKDYAGLTWQNAADTLVQKKSGMYLLGLFVSAQFAATKVQADLDDLDFFPFPTLGTTFDAEGALDAPIDIWQVSSKSANLAAETDSAKAYMEFWAKGSTQILMFQNQPGLIPAAKDADTSTYSSLQKKAVEIVGKATRITQFLDRDTRPDFAGSNGMQSFLQKFLANPGQDLVAYQKTIQDFWDQLPPLT